MIRSSYTILFLSFYLTLCQVIVNCDEDVTPFEDYNKFNSRIVTVEQYIRQNNLSSPEECARTCNPSNYKKRCYYNFYLEQYATQTRACDYCFPNRTNNCQCIVADGVVRSVTTANRMIPGPSIEVCEDDEVIIDVENHLEGSDVTIHWHGLHHRGSQYYDGVPFVTQCPILQGNKFRYIWTATHAGTHYWHAHTGFQKMDGLAGSIIVRQSSIKDQHSPLYDYDLSEHVLFVQDWIHELAGNRYPGCRSGRAKCASVSQIPDNILINGKGLYNSTTAQTNITIAEVFKVTAGRRYRFRLIGAVSLACPIQITVENHTISVIASDGEPMKPVQVDSIIFTSGERYDIIIDASNEPRHYCIEIKALGLCAELGIRQLARLEYLTKFSAITPTLFNKNDHRIEKTLTSLDGDCDQPLSNKVCISHLENAKEIDEEMLKPKADVKLFLPFSLYSYEDEELFHPNEFNSFFVPLGVDHMAGLMNNISYIPPPSPLLSQFSELNYDHFCNNTHSKINCGGICRCTHLVKIPLNAVVELILIDELEEPDLVHPFHLHGYSFYVMGSGRMDVNDSSISLLEKVIEMDKKNQLYRRNDFPPSKDTIAVPNKGYTVLRFKATNPGFWLLHCHFLNHLLTGMSMVLQVGNLSDFPPLPKHFPRCGDYTPDI
ncbi:hypothetical protein RI129_003564 [Pyrocoelia pectoralis]|uniref:Laccase n=1 Tax=Pyrocoelia pectoralis TaxID=417401 RepID=A0AAN7VI68_9COLE